LKESEHLRKSKEKEIAVLKEEAGASLQGKESLAQRLQGEVEQKDSEIQQLQSKIAALERVSCFVFLFLILFYWDYFIGIILLGLFYWYYFIGIILLGLFYWYYFIGIILLVLFYWYYFLVLFYGIILWYYFIGIFDDKKGIEGKIRAITRPNKRTGTTPRGGEG
jgi:hypothetical protein